MSTQICRFKEFDITRALPLLLLPLVHIYEEMETIDALPASIVDGESWILSLCLVTPVFMICMGTNLVFSRRSTAENLLKRGIQFLCWGLLLNFFRFFLPCAIKSIMDKSTDLLWECLYYTLTPDIYDFVGLAFLSFSLFARLKLSPLKILLVSFLALILDGIIPNFHTSNDYVNAALGRILWMDFDSCFPLLTWLIFPAIGYCFAAVYRNFETEEARRTFVKKVLAASVVGFLGMWFSLSSYGLDPLLIMCSPANDSITDLPNVISLTCLAGVLFGILYFLYHRFQDAKLFAGLIRISHAIIPFYFIQWVIIGWIEYLFVEFFREESVPVFTVPSYWILSTVVLVVSIALALWYTERKKKPGTLSA